MKAHRTVLSFLLAIAALTLVASPRASADTAVLSRSGVLYEILAATYGDVVPGAAGTSEARMPVLVLRTTRPGAAPVDELVDGTVSFDGKVNPSIAYEELTDTVFIAYTQYQGIMADVHFGVHRAGAWRVQSIRPSAGLYYSVNPKMALTRQSYVDIDDRGFPVVKTRSILSLVWWEEGGRSQARYAPVFVEDGVLNLDQTVAYNLNALAGADGATRNDGLPFSSYQFPSIQADLATNGGILVSFANLATQRQSVLKIGFPDDLRDIIASGVSGTQAYVRIHTPIGRGGRDGRLPKQVDTQANVSTVIAPASLVPTFFWPESGSMNVLRDDTAEDASPTVIKLRPDLSLDRVTAVVRDMALQN